MLIDLQTIALVVTVLQVVTFTFLFLRLVGAFWGRRR